LRLLDVFLLHCLHSDSPPDSPQEIADMAENQQRTAARGREPGLTLRRAGHEVVLTEWAGELLQAFAPMAQALDAAHSSGDYSAALNAAKAALQQPSLLPSARVLEAMAAAHDNSYVRFVRVQSQQTQQALLGLPWSPEQQARFEAMAQASLQAQNEIEAADTMPFESFRQNYVSPARLGLSSGSGVA
jgi:glutamate--cysteine ligase